MADQEQPTRVDPAPEEAESSLNAATAAMTIQGETTLPGPDAEEIESSLTAETATMSAQGQTTSPGTDAPASEPYRMFHSDKDPPGGKFDDTCAMCNKPTPKTCSICHSARYCSKECQKSDWPLHKLLCQKYLIGQQDKQPGHHVRAIVFANGDTTPSTPLLVWVALKGNKNRVGFTANMRPFVDAEDDEFETLRISRNPLRRRDLRGACIPGMAIFRGHCIVLKLLKAREGMSRNKSFETCAGALGFEFPFPLHGWVMALREDIGHDILRDINLQDFRDVIDYLRLHGTEDENGLSYAKPEGAPVMCASISCWGEVLINKSKHVIPVLVPERHPILKGEGDVSLISKLLGLTVTTWGAPRHEWLRNPTELLGGVSVGSNPTAVFLHMVIDSESESWGEAPAEEWSDIGNVLVVRNDGKDLDPVVLRTMAYYARECLFPLFESAMKSDDEEQVAKAKDTVLSQVTWDKMIEWRGIQRKENSDEY